MKKETIEQIKDWVILSLFFYGGMYLISLAGYLFD